MSEIIHRLIREDKVVECHGGMSFEPCDGKDGYIADYIVHDRADRFTGITLEDGMKLFERDQAILGDNPDKLTLIYKNGSFRFRVDEFSEGYDIWFIRTRRLNIKLIGIQGINND
jgi:hypothetical protein